MSIDETIAGFRYSAEILKSVEEERIAHDSDYNSTECEQIAEWLEELKAYKELDLEIPQHFTKSQIDWIKKYVILKKKEAKVEAIDECIGIVNIYKGSWYRDIDGDWVEPKCNAKTLIEKMIELQKE